MNEDEFKPRNYIIPCILKHVESDKSSVKICKSSCTKLWVVLKILIGFYFSFILLLSIGINIYVFGKEQGKTWQKHWD